ncbi:MAG: hypothetical protein GY803_23960 [Chloroflexi bacterium]|nr:hypothetical protein [Chloroflexota bacterium]
MPTHLHLVGLFFPTRCPNTAVFPYFHLIHAQTLPPRTRQLHPFPLAIRYVIPIAPNKKNGRSHPNGRQIRT